MMENKKTAVFRKIPLETLIEILHEVYEQGANFIDIEGTIHEKQDVIGIYVYPEYMEEGYGNDVGEEENSLLTDDTLDSLI